MERTIVLDRTTRALGLLVGPVLTLFAQPSPPPQAEAGKLPTVLHFCAQHCLTFTLENGQLTNYTNLAGQRNVKRVLTVESFTPEKVVIHRVDTGSDRMTADYSGRLSADGNTLSGNGWKMAWGAALSTLPGDDNERVLRDTIATAPRTAQANETQPKNAVATREGAATPALGPIPPPDVSDMKIETRPVEPDIGGLWQQDAQPANRYGFPQVKMLMVAFRNEFVGINLERVPFLAEDGTFVTGTYSSPTSFKTSIKDFNDSGVVRWYLADMSFPSPDHLIIVVSETKEQKRFTRISKIAPGELACNPQNPSHVSGPEALARSILYDKKDDSAMVCWSYVGAKEADAMAEVMYGDLLAKGSHMKKNGAAAFQLYQRSAMQGNYYGANRLAGAFESSTGAPESLQRSNYWGARTEWLDPGWVHTKSFLRTTQWALDTAFPCEVGNPRGLSGDAVFRAGRVAFEARAGDVAACWFQISSNQGSVRADVYLGVMYYFGIGVEQNQALGLERLKKAADAKDSWGMLYLANFFRWGVGVPMNLQLGISMWEEMMRRPDSFEVFTRVQGIVGGLNTSPAANARVQAAVKCGELQDAAKYSRDSNLISEARSCDSSAGLFDLFSTTANYTVYHPEEIFPEIFDPITLETDVELKERASVGWVRLTP